MPTIQELRKTALRKVLAMEFPEYSAKLLKIRTKTKGIQPFVLNVGQLLLHEKLEEQKAKFGYVRCLLLKARQWGGSTYVEGRFYHNIHMGPPGHRAFIMAHDIQATRNITKMAHTFHTEMEPLIRFAAETSQKSINFPARHSSYEVGTAGGKEVGRSQTIQYLHGSEISSWKNAADHAQSIIQAVPPQGPGTEIILESTAKGTGDYWHTACSNARAGLGEYTFVFVPWFWFDEYRAPLDDLELDLEDEAYMDLWELDLEQMQFRQNKIVEFGGGEAGRIKFKQEYPACSEDAFTGDVAGAYIEALYVIRAMRRDHRTTPKIGAKVWGIDPASRGKDRFIIMERQGKYMRRIGRWTGERPSKNRDRLAVLLKKHRPDAIVIDIGGQGDGFFDMMEPICDELGIDCIPFQGGESANNDELFKNRRQECYHDFRDWLMSDVPPCIHEENPDYREEIQADITNPLAVYDDKDRIRIENKASMVRRNMPSPDNADGGMMTFAKIVMPTSKKKKDKKFYDRPYVDWRAT